MNGSGASHNNNNNSITGHPGSVVIEPHHHHHHHSHPVCSRPLNYTSKAAGLTQGAKAVHSESSETETEDGNNDLVVVVDEPVLFRKKKITSFTIDELLKPDKSSVQKVIANTLHYCKAHSEQVLQSSKLLQEAEQVRGVKELSENLNSASRTTAIAVAVKAKERKESMESNGNESDADNECRRKSDEQLMKIEQQQDQQEQLQQQRRRMKSFTQQQPHGRIHSINASL